MLRLNLGRMNFDIAASGIGGAQVLYCARIRLLPELCRGIGIKC